MENYNHDRVCALKTKCNAFTQRGMYEKVPAVDSTSFYKNGTDAICANYSTCPDGQYRYSPGNDTTDVTCRKCPPGTYRNASVSGPNDQVCTLNVAWMFFESS